MNKMYRFSKVKVPKNRRLSTFLDIKVLNCKDNYIYGYNSLNLR